MDKVEHDIMNYQDQGQSYLPKSKAEAADNVDTRWLDSSQYHKKTEFNNYCFIIHFSNNLPMQALLFEFVKVGKHYIDKRLGNKVNFELNMITVSSTELINCLKLALKWTPKKRNVVPFNLLNKILCPEKNSISLTEVFHQAELKWNGLPESTLLCTTLTNSL